MNVQVRVALDKQAHPERYCKEPRCLWKVIALDHDSIGPEPVYLPKPDCPGGRCPRHQRKPELGKQSQSLDARDILNAKGSL